MSLRLMSLLVSVGCVLFLAPNGTAAQAAGDEGDKDRQITQLREQVKKLEARLAELEQQVKPLLARQNGAAGDAQAAAKPARAAQPAGRDEARVAKARVKAGERMRGDLKKHSRQELQQAEELYQVANKNWRSEQARQSLQQMVEKFPDVNRTGCAVLYLGQMSEGEERERLLTDAAEKYGDCYYGNGVQVGAYARFLLALYYKDVGQQDKANKLFDEIRKKYPDAVDHGGRWLVAQIPA